MTGDEQGILVARLPEERRYEPIIVTTLRRYVRRQRSWFRRDHRITWLAGDAEGNAAETIRRWRHVS